MINRRDAWPAGNARAGRDARTGRDTRPCVSTGKRYYLLVPAAIIAHLNPMVAVDESSFK